MKSFRAGKVTNFRCFLSFIFFIGQIVICIPCDIGDVIKIKLSALFFFHVSVMPQKFL